MSNKTKGVKTAICKLSSEEFCEHEVYGSGYSKEHLGKYQKMKSMALIQYGKRFTMNDYRRMFGFPMTTRKKLDEKDTQMLANWASNQV
jgi:hypothetical protein